MDSIFFILSKLIWALLSPGNLMVFSFVFGLVLLWLGFQRLAKWILIPTSIFALAITIYPIGDIVIQPLEKRFAQPNPMPAQIDGIILLGGGEDLKRSLSWQHPELGLGGDRYLATKYLSMQYPEAPVIFTGGSGLMGMQNKGSEGNFAYELLTRTGIKSDRITLESNSRNTYENFRYTKPLLPKADGHYLLVTSAFHMPRAVGIARKMGVNVTPYPVDYRSSSADYRYADVYLFEHLKSLEPGWREWIGLTAYYLTGKTSEWLPAPESSKSTSKTD